MTLARYAWSHPFSRDPETQPPKVGRLGPRAPQPIGVPRRFSARTEQWRIRPSTRPHRSPTSTMSSPPGSQWNTLSGWREGANNVDLLGPPGPSVRSLRAPPRFRGLRAPPFGPSGPLFGWPSRPVFAGFLGPLFVAGSCSLRSENPPDGGPVPVRRLARGSVPVRKVCPLASPVLLVAS
jgi:hypothetical protein